MKTINNLLLGTAAGAILALALWANTATSAPNDDPCDDCSHWAGNFKGNNL